MEQPTVSLYCLDHANQRALFVETAPAVDLLRAPFYYIAQYDAAQLRSVLGLIRSAWALEDGRFGWHIVVPANTTATVYVPAGESAEVREGDGPASEAAGVWFLRRESGAAVYEVGAGEYRFSSAGS